jgi:xanthine/uracil permease
MSPKANDKSTHHSVAVSGLRVISMCSFTRRDRVILTAGLSFGIGNLLVPTWSSYSASILHPPSLFCVWKAVTDRRFPLLLLSVFTYAGSNTALLGFLDSIIIILETPFLIAGIVCSLLNAILPDDPDSSILEMEEDADVEAGKEVELAEDSKRD